MQQCEAFYCLVNGRGLVLNKSNSQGSGSAWYDIFPSALFYEIGARYSGRSSFQAKMRAIADTWLTALPALSNNWKPRRVRLQNHVPGQPILDRTGHGHRYRLARLMAYVQFRGRNKVSRRGGPMYDANGMRSANPFYENTGLLRASPRRAYERRVGPPLSTTQHLNRIFSPGSDARPGWAVRPGTGEIMMSTVSLGAPPTGRLRLFHEFLRRRRLDCPGRSPLRPKIARLLGRWLLHVAANANLFYPNTLPPTMQASAAWVQQTGMPRVSPTKDYGTWP